MIPQIKTAIRIMREARSRSLDRRLSTRFAEEKKATQNWLIGLDERMKEESLAHVLWVHGITVGNRAMATALREYLLGTRVYPEPIQRQDPAAEPDATVTLRPPAVPVTLRDKHLADVDAQAALFTEK